MTFPNHKIPFRHHLMITLICNKLLSVFWSFSPLFLSLIKRLILFLGDSDIQTLDRAVWIHVLHIWCCWQHFFPQIAKNSKIKNTECPLVRRSSQHNTHCSHSTWQSQQLGFPLCCRHMRFPRTNCDDRDHRGLFCRYKEHVMTTCIFCVVCKSWKDLCQSSKCT